MRPIIEIQRYSISNKQIHPLHYQRPIVIFLRGRQLYFMIPPLRRGIGKNLFSESV